MSDVICTVLLISYNHGLYIEKAIRSILSQKTNFNYIIKVFDDASTDNTKAILEKFSKLNPNKFFFDISLKNLGAQANIFRALKSVDTKYFMYLEADDYWCDENKIDLQLSLMEKHPECSFCSTNNLIINKNGDKYLLQKHNTTEIKPGIFSKNVVSIDDIHSDRGYITHISTRCIRTSAIDWNNIKNIESILLDAAQFFYLLSKGKMLWIDKVCSVYVKNPNGVWAGSAPEKRLDLFWKGLISVNEDTDFIFWKKITELLLVVSQYWLSLSSPPPKNKQYKHRNLPLIKNNTVSCSKFNLLRYKFLSKVTLGKTRQRYIHKYSKFSNKQNNTLYSVDYLKYNSMNLFDHVQLMFKVQSLHSKTFSGFKNSFNGKDVVLVATGPTLAQFKTIPNAIYVGVNKAFFNDDITLDYLFMQDMNAVSSYIERCKSYKNPNLKRFYGIMQSNLVDGWIIPEDIAIQHNAARYYTFARWDINSMFNNPEQFSLDISSQPLCCSGSVVFSAMQFILYCNPKRIYIVGCDCSSNGYFDGTSQTALTDSSFTSVLHGWKLLKTFINIYYPHIEVISVNPVGLKGLFLDLYT